MPPYADAGSPVVQLAVAAIVDADVKFAEQAHRQAQVVASRDAWHEDQDFIEAMSARWDEE